MLEDLELTDEATYKLLQRGDTLGVFQLDGGPMRALLRSMRPDTFEDISAVGALYRPGPMGADSHNKYARRKTGREPVEALHPELAEALEDVLGETYGLIVYQEQVMAIAQKLAGYTLGQADILRRAMGKKKKEELDKQFAGFSAGMTERGYSHARDQGAVGHAAALLRLRLQQGPLGGLRPGVLLDRLPQGQLPGRIHGGPADVDARRQGQVGDLSQRVPPDEDPGAAARRQRVARQLHARSATTSASASPRSATSASTSSTGWWPARTEKGRYADFNDFMDKVPVHVCNKRVIESLIKAGAFDEMKHKRRALVTIHEMAVDQYIDIKKNEAIGQDSLFGGLDEADGGFGVNVAIPDIDDWDKMTLLGHEREMLGLYVSDHPLLGLEHVLQAGTDCTIGQLMLDEERPHGSTLTISGLVTSVQRKITKKGDSWATVTLEDLDGAIEVLLFPSAYQLASSHLVEDAIIRVKGQLSRDKDQPELRAQEVTVPDLSDGPSGPVTVNLPQTRINPGVVDSLKEVLATHPGVTEVLLNVRMRDKTIVLKVGDHHRVTPSPALFADLKQLLGPGCLSG